MGLPSKRIFQTYNRRIRAETIRVNGAPVKFYRNGKKWHVRIINAKVKVERVV